MPPLITYLLIATLIAYGAIIAGELLITRRVTRFLLEAAAIASVVIVLGSTTGFPAPRRAFGGATPLLAIALMFVCTLLGIAAHYFFYLRTAFSWRSLLKPMCITPIVLLPLLGSVQASSGIAPIQVVSLAFLAFQNGFFWKVVIERVSKSA
jgi:hypothetical protein